MSVLMFKNRFAELVRDGVKTQTIRPARKRPIVPGDLLSLRRWSGRAYASPQVELLETVCRSTADVTIHATRIVAVDRQPLTVDEMRDFARRDGFKDATDFLKFFETQHGLPFVGTLIRW